MAHFHLTLPFDVIYSYVPNDTIHLYSDLNIEMNHIFLSAIRFHFDYAVFLDGIIGIKIYVYG